MITFERSQAAERGRVQPVRRLHAPAPMPPVAEATLPTLWRKLGCPCGGGCPECGDDLAEPNVQAKLRIGAPDDEFEQEADRVADQVMRMPEPGIRRQPQEEQEEEELLQAKGASGGRQAPLQLQGAQDEEEEHDVFLLEEA